MLLGSRIFLTGAQSESLLAASTVLSGLGYDVTTYHDDRQAVDAAKVAPPDLLLMTMGPALRNLAAFRQLKSDVRTSQIPLLVAASQGHVGKMVAAVDLGADGYLTLPTDERELVSKVKALLRLREREKELEVKNRWLIEREQALEEKNRELERKFEEMVSVQRTLQAIAESGDSGFIMVDSGRVIRATNRKLGELLQLDSRKLVGQREDDVVAEILSSRVKEPEAFAASVEALSREPDQVVVDEIEVLRPYPRVLQRFSGPVFDEHGAIMGRIEVFRDITNNKRSERRMRNMYKRERRIAEILQKHLLPKELPTVPGLEIGTRYEPAIEGMVIGGDYYDVIWLGGQRVAIAVADVCGKGMAAAVQTYLVKYSLRAFAREDPEPAVVVSRLNWTFCQEAEAGAFVTLAYALLDFRKRRLSYCLAGHPPPIVYRGGSGECHTLEPCGGAVGVLPEARYEQRHIQLAGRDAVVFFTDGITEARSPEGFFGDDRLERVVAAHAGGGAQALANGIFKAVTEFTDGRLADDAAVVALKLAD